MLRRLLIASLVSGFAMGPAVAQTSAYDWTGLYAGINAGYGGNKFNYPVSGNFNGNLLGLSALQGRNLTYLDRDWERARQHRFRIGVQRQLSSAIVAEVAYLGSRTDQIQVVTPVHRGPAGTQSLSRPSSR